MASALSVFRGRERKEASAPPIPLCFLFVNPKRRFLQPDVHDLTAPFAFSRVSSRLVIRFPRNEETARFSSIG